MNSARVKGIRPLVVPDVEGMTQKEAAHAYLDAGLMPVPWRVSEGTKVLALSGVKMHEIKTTHADIDKWLRHWRCGLLTSQSSGLIAIDVDNKPKFRAWIAEIGLDVPDTAWAETGRGGSHLVFDARGLANGSWPRQGRLPGADLKSNGFIATEPSLHPNREPYLWHARGVAPLGRLGASLAAYSDPRRPAGDDGARQDPDVLRQACTAAGDGEQHEALLAYVLELQNLGYRSGDIVRLCVSLGLRNFDERRPWRESDFRGLLKDGVVGDATPEEQAILASFPTREQWVRSRRGKSAWHDFSALATGTRTRAVAAYGRRADDVALLYPAKEHSLYGETESGKDWFLVAVVKPMLEDEQSVVWLDFEEGDEVEIGSRLLNAGLDPELLCDPALFRYATPIDRKEADACLAWALEHGPPDLVVFDGVTAAYGLYGWPVKENDSATAFRAHLVKPCLAAGAATISTDHVVKDAKNQGRYALGGVMKLNMVNGAAYLLEAKSPIVRGGEGASRLLLTKDRPGAIKPDCGKTKDPAIRFAGTLTVKSSGPERGELLVDIIPPQPQDSTSDAADGAEVPADVLRAVHERFADAGALGLSKTAVKTAWHGPHARQVPLAIDLLLAAGYLAPAVRSTSGARLAAKKPWDGGPEAVKFRARPE